MVGSERLTQLRFGDDGNGNDIGAEFAEALQIAKDDLRADRVRAHAILHDDNKVVTRADDGSLAFDFTIVDALYDQILAIGIRPVVELSFMPAAIAKDPDETVFAYRGIISPPADWAEWRAVVRALAAHLVERYGIDEVRTWGFEVWNEPNLEVFWTGTQDEYLRLYDESAAAVKGVDDRLLVGGPSTAAGEWIEALTAHAETDQVPLDFVTSHTYGNLPIDTRPSLDRHGFAGHPDLVDGVGRRLDALRTDPRRRHRRAVRAVRLPGRPAPHASLGVLGHQRPLRGTRPPAGAVPQRIRPAHRGQPAQAALLGRAPGRAPGRHGAGGRALAATARRCSCAPGRPGTTTARSTSWCGTARSTAS